MTDDQNLCHVALYGSLRRGLPAHGALDLARDLIHAGPCTLRGALVDLGDYPGLIGGTGTVCGELYEIADDSALLRLDAFEEFRSDDVSGSLYLRQKTRLITPDRHAWTYVYNRDFTGAPVIASGDWITHLEETNAGNQTFPA